MMKRFLVGGGMMMASVALAAGAIWYIRAHAPEVAAVPAGSSSLLTMSDATTAAASSLDPDTATPKPTSNDLSVSSSNDSSQVLGSNTASSTSASSSASSTVPTPDQFGQYDQYKSATQALFGDLSAGTGAAAEAGKQVTVNYRGWLTNGKEFDESYARGKPYSFTIGAHTVITGWEEAIMGMKVGGKRRFIIPPSVGYGATEQNGIPANSVLVFDVELLAVQ